MLQLCSSLLECPILMGIHLSDNGLQSNPEQLLEILDKFGIRNEDVLALSSAQTRRSPQAHGKNSSRCFRNTSRRRDGHRGCDEAMSFDYSAHLKKYMRVSSPSKRNEGSTGPNDDE